MSILGYFTSGYKLKNAKKLTASARKKEGAEADQLFQKAYQNFESVSESRSCYVEALYNWGFALMHQAQTKSGEEADKLFQEANMKFSFCLTISPNHLGARVDGGVALMNQAKAKGAGIDDELNVKAKEWFLKAEKIQNGFASYNLACLSALEGNQTECQKYLENARDTGLVPELEAVQNDDDLGPVKNRKWFKDFLESLQEPEEEPENEEETEAVPETKEQPKRKKAPAKPRASTAKSKKPDAENASDTEKSGEDVKEEQKNK